MLKLAYALSSISRANGGISESVRRLVQSLPADASARVLGLRDAYTDADVGLWAPIPCATWPVRLSRALGYAPGYAAALAQADADVHHVAGLWMYPSIASLRCSRRTRRPYIISPHGMLDAWALRHSRWKKQIALALFERAHLERAACLHALCQAEADAIRALGLRNPICVVPNGVDLPAPAANPAPPPWAGSFAPDDPVMLYLGRLHPKKGLVPLLEAWARARHPRWRLVVAGWDQGDHRRDLAGLVNQLGLTASVHFAGPLHGSAKDAAFRAASGFILASFSEGLPMTILEAWSYGVPVLMTPACNLPIGFAKGAAIEISTEPDQLAHALLGYFQMTDSARAEIGRRGRALVVQHFDWRHIAQKMYRVYKWVAGRDARPDDVQL